MHIGENIRLKHKMIDELLDLIKHNRTEEFLLKLEKYYFKHNLNVNCTNEYNNTMLHIACRCRNYDIVKELVENYDAKVNIQNDDKRTPLHIAAIYGSIDSIMYVFNDISTKKNISNVSKIISLLVDKAPHVLLIKDKDGMTAKKYLASYVGIDFNEILKKKHKRYKKYVDFFDLIEKHSSDNDDFELSVTIFCNLKGN